MSYLSYIKKIIETSSRHAPTQLFNPLINIVYNNVDTIIVSPTSVAEAPDMKYMATSLSTSTTEPSVVPFNRLLTAYNAKIGKKRSLEEIESGEVLEEHAVKHNAVECSSFNAISGDMNARDSAYVLSPCTPIFRPLFSPTCEDVPSASCRRGNCLMYQSTRGCGFNTKCNLIHIDPEIGSEAWYLL